jgi:DNA-binding MarR family transcriptional regulator
MSTPETMIDVDEADLFDLLSSFQYLQGQNLRMSTHLCDVLDLGPTDLRVLVYLFRKDAVSPKEISGLLDHTTGAVTALVDRLEKAGHLERRPHPTDRRSQTLHLTNAGIQAVHQIRDAYQNAFDGVFTGPALRTAAETLRSLGDSLTPHLPAAETTNTPATEPTL